jgi:hypothetical protein
MRHTRHLDMAARMRQPASDSPAEQALVDALEHCRPWADEAAVARELSRWTREYHADRVSADDVWAVAIEVVARLAKEAETDVEGVASAVSYLLQNVAQGREPLDYGDVLARTVFKYPSGPAVPSPRASGYAPPLDDPPREPAVPERTRRHYQQRFGSFDALDHFLRRLEYRNDMVALTKGNRLVEGGRTKAAARQWLLRHPGEHAKDAPPPRRRASSG